MTSYAILGLLGRGPQSGYDLVALPQRTIAQSWSITNSQAYGELARLETAWVHQGNSDPRTKDAGQTRLPAHPDGRAALDTWLQERGLVPDAFAATSSSRCSSRTASRLASWPIRASGSPKRSTHGFTRCATN